jgi:hypothetical protein
MKVFYSTAKTERELLQEVDQHRSFDEAEVELARFKAQEKINPAYWDRVRIFKITVKEVPRTANAKPKSRKRTPEATAQ